MIQFDFLSLAEARKLSYAYDLWLFHEPEHLMLQSTDGWRVLTATRTKDNLIVAHLPVHIRDALAISPVRASFGSIQCSSTIQAKTLYEFIAYVCGKLAQEGVSRLRLTGFSHDLAPHQSSMITTLLLNQGFEIQQAALGALLPVKGRFEEGLNEWESRRLRQARDAGLTNKEMSPENMRKVFDFIANCRSERGYTLGIDFHTLERTVGLFPGRFFLFGVFNGSELVAASISIDIGNRVLYDFHSAHPRKYDSLSPIVLLKERMFDFCRENAFLILDLGTSAIDGGPNFGLIDFKLGLGAKATTKFVFQKDL